MINYMINYIVGAPTFLFLSATKDKPKNRSKDRPLHKKESGPPQKDRPYIRTRKAPASEGGLYKRAQEALFGGSTWRIGGVPSFGVLDACCAGRRTKG
jgi:hypothetical protein